MGNYHFWGNMIYQPDKIYFPQLITFPCNISLKTYYFNESNFQKYTDHLYSLHSFHTFEIHVMYDLHAKSFKNYYSANKIDILYICYGVERIHISYKHTWLFVYLWKSIKILQYWIWISYHSWSTTNDFHYKFPGCVQFSFIKGHCRIRL